MILHIFKNNNWVKNIKPSVVVLLGIFFLIVLSLFLFDFSTNNKTCKIEKASLRDIDIAIHRRGTLEASRFVQIGSEIPSNSAKVIMLKKEGSSVHKNEIIARFDTKPFEDMLLVWKNKIEQAKAQMIQADKDVDLQKNKSIDSLKKLNNYIKLAKIKLQDTRDGEGVLKLHEFEKELSLLQEKKLSCQQDKDEYMVLKTKGFISEHEYENIVGQCKRYEQNVVSAKEKLNNYKKFTWPGLISEKEIALNQFEEEYKNKKIQLNLELENKKAQLQNGKSNYRYTLQEYGKIESYLNKCELFAPISGTLLYKDIMKNGKSYKIGIGDNVWQNQSFLLIPDTNNMIVHTDIKEMDIKNIYVGMPVSIRIDAYQKMKLDGNISFIDVIAQTKNELSNKYFSVLVSVEKKFDLDLRSGLSADIDIIVENNKNLLSINVKALHSDEKGTFVYLCINDKKVKRYVQLGSIGEQYAIVKFGVNKGDKVVIR